MKQLYPILSQTDEICTQIHKLCLFFDVVLDLFTISTRAKNAGDEKLYIVIIDKITKNLQHFTESDITSIIDELSKIKHSIEIQIDPIIKSKLSPIMSKLSDLNDIFPLRDFVSSTLHTLELQDDKLLTMSSFTYKLIGLQFTIRKINASNDEIRKTIREF